MFLTRAFLASGVTLAALGMLCLGSSPARADDVAIVQPSPVPGPTSDAPPPPPAPADKPIDMLDVACACGCGVFDVGDIYSMVPTNPHGGMVWFRYSYQNQDQNWEGSHPGLASDNQDKQIQTSFYTVGAQYTFNSKWTIMGELPSYGRSFTTTDDGTIQGPNGSIYTANVFALGDLRLMADYTGLQSNMNTGLIVGVKLPTGLWNSPTGVLGGPLFDRDSLPGTGSTDLLMGAYHVGTLDAAHKVPYQIQANYSVAVFTQQDYRPGNELDTAVGVGYNLGPIIGNQTTPWLNVLGSFRGHDTGGNADFLNSGYSRILLAPGLECRFGKYRVFADVELPIFQYTNSAINTSIEDTAGQLIANQLYKLQISHDF
jgi:hypothetical protein